MTITTSAAASTTTAVTSSANPSETGSAVTFTATVTSEGSPVTTGTVTFNEGAAVLQGATAVDVDGHVAFTTSALAEGTHSITAQYDGDAGHGERSATLSQVVDNATTVNGNTFCNDASALTVNDAGTGAPYPSHVVVSGLAGTISKVTVQLKNVTHAFPDDLDVLLAGPSGQHLEFLSDAGGSFPISGQTLTFDDSAANQRSDTSPIVGGTYRPTSYTATADSFPRPDRNARQHRGPEGTATLAAVFSGRSPNGSGAWRSWTIRSGPGPSPAGASRSRRRATRPRHRRLLVREPRLQVRAGDLHGDGDEQRIPVTTGAVTFQEGASVAGSVALDGAGHASFTTSSLTEGVHLIVASTAASPARSAQLRKHRPDDRQRDGQTGNIFCNPGAVAINDGVSPPTAATNTRPASSSPASGARHGQVTLRASCTFVADVDVIRSPGGGNWS